MSTPPVGPEPAPGPDLGTVTTPVPSNQDPRSEASAQEDRPTFDLDRLFRDPRTALVLMVVVFAAAFGTIGFYRYWSFSTYAWDLGIYNQAAYTTVFSHQFFYYTADLPAGTGGSLFAVHFSPFLLLLLPFYAAAPGPAVLLYLQSAGVAAGAFPAYGLAKLKLGSARWGLLVAGAYLVSPVTQGITWYDFHPEAFLPAAVLCAFYFLELRRPREFLAAWVVSLSIVEAIAPFLILFALFGLLASNRRRGEAPSPATKDLRRWLLVALAVAVVWLGVAYLALASFSSSAGAFGTNYGVYWSILGAKSPLDVYPQALLHPSLAFQALAYDSGAKVQYLLILFGAVAFLPWAGEDRYLLPALAWMGLAVLSNGPSFYALGDQYPAYALPFLFAGGIGGLVLVRDQLGRWRRSRWLSRLASVLVPRPRKRPLRVPEWAPGLALGGVLLTSSLVGAAVASPLLFAPADPFTEITYGLPTVTSHDELVHQVISLLPPGASVLTTNALFPEVSGRADAYVLPTSSYFVGGATFTSQVDHYVNESDYILVDYVGDAYSAEILQAFVDFQGFSLRAAEGGAYLYERGYAGPPDPFVPVGPTVIAPSALTPGSASLDLAAPGPSGPSLYHAPGNSQGNEFWSGLNLYPLPPGTYTATLSLREEGGGSGPALDSELLQVPLSVGEAIVNPSPTGHDYAFSVEEDSSKIAVVNSTTLPGAGNQAELWENTTLTGTLREGGAIDSEGWVVSASSALWLYEITVTQVAALP